MDRSFLSQTEVINASRSWVCVRLATYEDAEEAKLLKALFTGPTGDLENTVFAMLTPDASTRLVRSGRTPGFAFRDAQQMAEYMKKAAAYYKADAKVPADGPLPVLGNFRLALDVAACDNQPLIAVVAEDANERERLSKTLAPLAWKDEFIGRAAYATTAGGKELAPVTGVKIKSGIVVVSPDKFGEKGAVLGQIDGSADKAKIEAELRTALNRFQPIYKDHGQHVHEGFVKGVFWETLLPVTDPHSPYRPNPRTGK